MKLRAAYELYAYGTSEGVTKSWDTRGRGRKPVEHKGGPLRLKTAEEMKGQPRHRPENEGIGQTTEEAKRKSADGEWSPEALAHMRASVEEVLAGKTPAVGKPKIIMLGGGTSSGKSTLSKSLYGEQPNFARIDSDEFKTRIPEYEGLKQEDPQNAPHRVHEESSYMTKMALAEAQARHLNIVYDSTSSSPRTIDDIKKLAKRGYDVEMLFVDVPVNEAIKSAHYRALYSDDPASRGRFVNEKIIRSSNLQAPKQFFAAKDMPEVSRIRLYTRAHGTAPPELAYDRESGKPGRIYDGEAMKRYEQKSKGTAI